MMKPRLGIIAVAKENQYRAEIEGMFQHYKEKFGGDEGLDAVFPDSVLFDEADVVEAARRLEQGGADAIVLLVGTWIFSSIIISAVNDLHVPFVLYGLSDEVANGNLGASIQIKYVLEEMGKRFLYLCGPARDDQNEREILRYVRAAWVTHAMRNRRLATIGGKCMMMYQTQVNEFDWKRVFGVDFPQYDASQVFKEMENVSDDEARAVEADFLKRVDAVHWQLPNGESLPENAVFFQAKLYLAFKRLQKLYGIDFFANKCMPEMSALPYGPGCAACLATAMLNDDGVITACEADVPAGISMYMLNLLTGQKVFFADIARLHKGENGITFFNCGTAPISMADREKGVELWPIPGNIADEAVPREYACGKMNGACIRMELKEGMKVTVMRLGGNGDTLRMHVANATTIRRSVMPDEVIGQRWPGFGLKFEEDRKEFLKNTVGHHYSLVMGDWSEELRVIAGLYGIGYIYNH